jgi:hypothetical protein
MIRVDVWLPDPASVLATGAFGAGALVRLERAASIAGSYTEVTTIAIVATTLQYRYWDAAGDATSFYRWRVSDAAGSVFSDYSDPFAGSSPAASVFPTSYASLDRLLGMFNTRPTNPARLARLGQLLGTATQQLIEACGGRDYFLHPSSGVDTAWYETLPERPRGMSAFDRQVLHVHDGIVSLASLEVSLDFGTTYQTVAPSDYVLRGDDPSSDAPVPTGEPYFHVVLNPFGSTIAFPRGTKVIRPTGLRGWATVPETLVEGTAQRARQLAFAEGSFSGAQAGGMDEFGSPATSDRFWPQSTWNFISEQASRFDGCRV